MDGFIHYRSRQNILILWDKNSWEIVQFPTTLSLTMDLIVKLGSEIID